MVSKRIKKKKRKRMGRKEILVELTIQVVKVAVVSLTIRDLQKVTLKLKIWFIT